MVLGTMRDLKIRLEYDIEDTFRAGCDTSYSSERALWYQCNLTAYNGTIERIKITGIPLGQRNPGGVWRQACRVRGHQFKALTQGTHTNKCSIEFTTAPFMRPWANVRRLGYTKCCLDVIHIMRISSCVLVSQCVHSLNAYVQE
jgi:hypothetical protein